MQLKSTLITWKLLLRIYRNTTSKWLFSFRWLLGLRQWKYSILWDWGWSQVWQNISVMKHWTWFIFYTLNGILGKQHQATKLIEIKNSWKLGKYGVKGEGSMIQAFHVFNTIEGISFSNCCQRWDAKIDEVFDQVQHGRSYVLKYLGEKKRIIPSLFCLFAKKVVFCVF